MTDKEKLQQLFQAALQDSNFDTKKPLARAFPSVPTPTAQVVEQVSAPEPSPDPVAQAPVVQNLEPLVQPMPNAGLDEATSAELGALLDAQIKRKARQRKRELVVTLLVCFGLTGGGYGWFIQSPNRVQAFNDAIKEIRSVGDIKGLVAKYQKALDRIAARSKQIDEATIAMGGDPTLETTEDPYFTAETEKLTGEKMKSLGERNKRLEATLGKLAKKPGVAEKVAEAASESETAGKPGKAKEDDMSKTAANNSFVWDK